MSRAKPNMHISWNFRWSWSCSRLILVVSSLGWSGDDFRSVKMVEARFQHVFLFPCSFLTRFDVSAPFVSWSRVLGWASVGLMFLSLWFGFVVCWSFCFCWALCMFSNSINKISADKKKNNRMVTYLYFNLLIFVFVFLICWSVLGVTSRRTLEASLFFRTL